MWLAISEARKTAALAWSRGSPSLPNTVLPISTSRIPGTSSKTLCSISVSVAPGSMALARIPCSPNSNARMRVKQTIAALEEE